MTVTALIGALLALMPAVRPKTEREIDRSELLRLERDLHLQKLVAAHWKDEAQRIAIQSRCERDTLQARIAGLERERDDWQARAMRWPVEQAMHQQAQQYQALANQQAQQALAQQQAHAYANAMYGTAASQALAQQLAQYQGMLGAQPASVFDGWCNCVPSRSQVWAANRGD